MPTFSFRIRKLTDRQWIDKLRELSKSCNRFQKVSFSIPLVGHHASEITKKTWAEDDSVLQKAIEIESMLVASVTYTLWQDVSVTLARDQQNPLTDYAALSVPDNQSLSPEVIFPLTKSATRILEELSLPLQSLDALGAGVKAHYEAREQYLARQEREVSSFFTKMADFSRQQTIEHETKMARLEADFASRQQALDEQHQKRLLALEARDAELEAKRAAFDLQESRGMRRKLREDQKSEMKELIKRFTLTPETEAKRTPVLVALTLTAAVLAAIAVYLLTRDAADGDGNFKYFLAARQFGYTAAAVGFVWFFIHWSNRWFQRHADEELRLKRLSLDLDRASWLFEMILDWQKETKQEFPAELIRQFGKNLYAVDGVGGDDMTKADLLASLLGSAASLKVKGAGGEATFDRKSLRDLDKPD